MLRVRRTCSHSLGLFVCLFVCVIARDYNHVFLFVWSQEIIIIFSWWSSYELLLKPDYATRLSSVGTRRILYPISLMPVEKFCIELGFLICRMFETQELFFWYGKWGAMASWLVRLSPDRAVRDRALVWDIVLRSWARHLILTVSLSTQVYIWVKAKLILGVKGGEGGVLTLQWTSIPSRGE